MIPEFSPEQIAKFEAALADQDFGYFCQCRLFGLSLAETLGQPMEPEAVFELAHLKEVAELLAQALIADWRQRINPRAEHFP